MKRLRLFFIVMVFVLASCSSGGSTKHNLDGSVLIFHPENLAVVGSACEGKGALFDLVSDSPVRITPDGEDSIWTKLATGTITEEGNCRLKFAVDLPEASSYTFEVGARLPVIRPRETIDRPNGWWVTLDWDATSEVPNP